MIMQCDILADKTELECFWLIQIRYPYKFSRVRDITGLPDHWRCDFLTV